MKDAFSAQPDTEPIEVLLRKNRRNGAGWHPFRFTDEGMIIVEAPPERLATYFSRYVLRKLGIPTVGHLLLQPQANTYEEFDPVYGVPLEGAPQSVDTVPVLDLRFRTFSRYSLDPDGLPCPTDVPPAITTRISDDGQMLLKFVLPS